MSSPSSVITIFGASGFIGRQILRSLSETSNPQNIALRLASRNVAASPQSRWARLAPSVQAISQIPCDISDPHQVARAIDGATHVINCVGILHETPSRGLTFDRVQYHGPKAIADAITANKTNVKNVVHLSAIGASEHSNSRYARTKAKGESQIQRIATAGVPQVTILRPSIVFGPEDSFFNRFEELSRYLPFLPLVGGGTSKFQPVHVEDVASAVIKSLRLDDKEDEDADTTAGDTAADTYELGGQSVFTFKQLMELVLEVTGRRRLLLPIPFSVANVQGAAFETLHNFIPKIPPLLTRDQVRLLEKDNVVPPGARTFYDLKIEPKQCTVETISYIR